MSALISTFPRRLGWAVLALVLGFGAVAWFTWTNDFAATRSMTDGDFMTRFLAIPALFAVVVFGSLTALAGTSASAAASTPAPAATETAKPFMAQVVGLQWLNPLQRRDYPTEWQLLWTLGLVQPNKDDDMVKAEPKLFSKLQMVAMIAAGNNGKETFEGYHEKYLDQLTTLFHDVYFADSKYFYNAHSLENKKTWRRAGRYPYRIRLAY